MNAQFLPKWRRCLGRFGCPAVADRRTGAHQFADIAYSASLETLPMLRSEGNMVHGILLK